MGTCLQHIVKYLSYKSYVANNLTITDRVILWGVLFTGRYGGSCWQLLNCLLRNSWLNLACNKRARGWKTGIATLSGQSRNFLSFLLPLLPTCTAEHGSILGCLSVILGSVSSNKSKQDDRVAMVKCDLLKDVVGKDNYTVSNYLDNKLRPRLSDDIVHLEDMGQLLANIRGALLTALIQILTGQARNLPKVTNAKWTLQNVNQLL